MKRRLYLLLAALALLAGCAAAGEPPAVSETWTGPDSVKVPILVYHHMDDAGGQSMTISEEGFRRQMDTLAQAGYQPVSLADLAAFADGTGSLPEKPVCITFDDGYASTYERAWPILRERGWPATVFVIGVSVGKDTYKDTGQSIIPHFGPAEMKEMADSGLMAVQSHTYDMHQSEALETDGPLRADMLPLAGESEETYAAALAADFDREAEVLAQGGVAPEDIIALSYPLSRRGDLTDRCLKELGIRITVTMDAGHINTVARGEPDSLYGLGRMNMTDSTSQEALLTYLAQ